MKRIAVFLDGTWEVVGSNTNVWRLKCLVQPKDANGVEQITYYDEGLGTAYGSKFRGGALGYGIDDAVVRAYEWIMENYDDGDEIFIFGFSRGAFTARSLSGFLSRCGLVTAGSPLSVTQLYRRYMRGDSRNDNSHTERLEKTWASLCRRRRLGDTLF